MHFFSIFHLLITITGIGSLALAAPAISITTSHPSAPSTFVAQSLPTVLPSTGATTTCTLPSSNTPLTTPLPPKDDPWYQPPDGWMTKYPGDILRLRPAPGNPIANLRWAGDCVGLQAFNILYRTTDSHYQPTWAVTTIFAPQKAFMGTSPYSMLSYQHPYDSAHINDSPSYKIYSDTTLQTAVSLFLRHGWFVNVPDYEGPNAAFGSGVMSGHASLDSVRAAVNGARAVGVPVGFWGGTSLNVAMYGYSGGSFATEWAAELQVQYAPELKFVGAGIGGAFPNATNALRNLVGQFSTHLKALIAGIGIENPNAQTVAIGLLQKSNWADAVAAVESMPTDQLQNFTNALLQNQIIQTIINRDMMLGYHGVPEMPLLIHRADNDQISPTADTTSLYDRYCGVGANIYYHVSHYWSDKDDPHTKEGVYGTFLAAEGLALMFNGTFPKGCQMNEIWEWPITIPIPLGFTA